MEKSRRIRRTKQDLENSILQAARDLIEETGFNNVTISAIVQKAKIEPAVFYNRYNDLNDLFDKFVREFDYWLNDSFNFDPVNNSSQVNCENLLLGLVDSINSSAVMQKLLIWELVDHNYITRRTADNRERHSKNLVEYFENTHSDPEIDISVSSALIISGIYYLSMHKRISTFCGINFNSKEGLNLLKKNIQALVSRIYSNTDVEKNNKKMIENNSIEIAHKLLSNNVDIEIVREATGLSYSVLNKLILKKGQQKE